MKIPLYLRLNKFLNDPDSYTLREDDCRTHVCQGRVHRPLSRQHFSSLVFRSCNMLCRLKLLPRRYCELTEQEIDALSAK